MNNTASSPAFPTIFANCNLDDVNLLLRVGRATESDAAQYVEWWNTSGKRLTTAKLMTRVVYLPGNVEVRAPYIVLR